MKISKGLSVSQMIISFIMITVWVVVFTAGLLVNSEPYRNIISNYAENTEKKEYTEENHYTALEVFEAWVVVLLCYTPTNILFLCMIAGLLGALSRIAILHVNTDDGDDLPDDKTNPLLSGIFRGMFVYLLVISGILVIDEAPFTAPTQVQYARLAGIMSLLSFLLSYNPDRFKTFLSKAYDGIDKVANRDRG